jgi:SAM-dependent methyltransferase
MNEPLFDEYAVNYDEALQRGLDVSGESKVFFAEGRVRILDAVLRAMRFTPGRVLDFGCGTGSGVPSLLRLTGVERVVGADVSARSLQKAAQTVKDSRVEFVPMDGLAGHAPFDLVFCNGVFHHIPPAQRKHALASIDAVLVSGGLFAMWENNPWNPGTRYIMSRIPFDRDAVTISPWQADRLVQSCGLRKICRTHAFVFPSWLKCLRPLERLLASLPIGAQYMVLAREPGPRIVR